MRTQFCENRVSCAGVGRVLRCVSADPLENARGPCTASMHVCNHHVIGRAVEYP